MRGRRNNPLLVVTLAALVVGCGTTQIIANDPQAIITVDGVPVGRGVGSVRQTGFPGSAQVSAKTEDGRTTHQTIRRSFGWPAGVLGLFTYGVCFLACWQYPDAVLVNLPPVRVEAAKGWEAPDASSPGADPWLRPPPGWRPAPEPAAPVAPPPP
jgi:hypothetical protein